MNIEAMRGHMERDCVLHSHSHTQAGPETCYHIAEVHASSEHCAWYVQVLVWMRAWCARFEMERL